MSHSRAQQRFRCQSCKAGAQAQASGSGQEFAIGKTARGPVVELKLDTLGHLPIGQITHLQLAC